MDANPTGIADDPDSGTTGVRFECVIPNSAVTGTDVNPTKSGIFGHGLLGDFTQVDDMIRFPNSEANDSNTTWCATNWAGFSEDDLGGVISALEDLSNFNKLTDRMQQGFVNMIYLGRAMLHPDGFDTDPAFKFDPDGVGGDDPTPVLDPAQGLFWEGISQGAIMGGALTALEPDLTQSVLNVVGMNYSTLLTPKHGLGAVPGHPQPRSVGQLSGPRAAAADPVADATALGPRRGERVRASHDRRSAAEHAGAPRAAAARLRGPSGLERGGQRWRRGRSVRRSTRPSSTPGGTGDDPLFGLTPIGSYPYSGSAAMVYYDGGPLNFAGTPDQTCTDENGDHAARDRPGAAGQPAAEPGERVRLRSAPVPAALGWTAWATM